MQMLMTPFNPSMQLSPHSRQRTLAYHPPKGRFKLIYQGLILPGLPAPLHYINFMSLIGQAKIPILYNKNILKHKALDTASVFVSSSPHLAGQLKSYSISEQCHFRSDAFNFDQQDVIQGYFPDFHFKRTDSALSVDLKVHTVNVLSHYTPLKWGVFEHWSLLCWCQGRVMFENHCYEVQGMGSFEYARSAHLPYMPVCFFTHHVLNLTDQLQVLLTQVRNQWNQIIYSRADLRNLDGRVESYKDNVFFQIQRLYPKVTTPNFKEMYLPREFLWQVYVKDCLLLEVKGKSRGDFKFGLAAGYAGSFQFNAIYNNQHYKGEAGYIEYIDMRPLHWQEKDQSALLELKNTEIQPCILKKD
ncbi:DUF6670 family protein [uncultured Acinetobacter sp.]|uniref:DUF6670 family protein n=1 Tax=uncultured Acinetobacter sp. TaxID=165433 RepID=UPI00258AAEDB|nr:DUF6670 family protein [uncultured Acinetobacter sp.]